VSKLAATLAAALALVPADVLAQGCAMCRTTLDGASDPLVGALNTSVLFMMAMPYLLVGSIGGWIFLNVWRRQGDEFDQPADAARKETTP
jgi:hypothetical protein